MYTYTHIYKHIYILHEGTHTCKHIHVLHIRTHITHTHIYTYTCIACDTATGVLPTAASVVTGARLLHYLYIHIHLHIIYISICIYVHTHMYTCTYM